jgi:acetyl-CoA carboxylase biotin carboxyl carrier protein
MTAPKERSTISKVKEIKELLDLLKDSDIEEIEIARDDLRIRIKRRGMLPAGTLYAPPPLIPAGQIETALVGPSASPEKKEFNANLVSIHSPMVGTFYRAPLPGAEPFVKEGDLIKKGQTLCIIEAMKLMNEIEAETAGRIDSILVDDAQPVEYGQSLFLIEPL